MASGFSMIETVISLALSLVVSSTALSLVRPFGLAARTADDLPAHAVLRDADAALYRAKGAGRNRVST